jgi:quinohemoprotein ethanol dehydrogenase
VLSAVNDKLLVFRADTGEKLLELSTGLSQMGPPITFVVDGKQYITVAGGPARAAAAGAGRGGAAAPPAGPPQPGHLLAFVLDGNAPVPGAAK